jgi:hypothetical protein
MKFSIFIEHDEDGRYVVDCTDPPGYLTEGDTLKEATASKLIQSSNPKLICKYLYRMRMKMVYLTFIPFSTGLIVILNAIWRVIALPCNTALHNFYNHYITIPLYLPLAIREVPRVLILSKRWTDWFIST